MSYSRGETNNSQGYLAVGESYENYTYSIDDEDNIGRDVEEEERKRVVINNAAEENEDDTNQTKLLLCAIIFPISHHVEVCPAYLFSLKNRFSNGHILSEHLLKMTNVDFSLFSFLHCTVPLHMSPQRTWDRAGKVTLAAFVSLFPTVCFQISPQIANFHRCFKKFGT